MASERAVMAANAGIASRMFVGIVFYLFVTRPRPRHRSPLALARGGTYGDCPISGPLQVFLVEREMLVVERHVAAGDDDVRDCRSHFERITVCDQQVADLARLDAAEPIADAEDLGGIHRHRLERCIARSEERRVGK